MCETVNRNKDAIALLKSTEVASFIFEENTSIFDIMTESCIHLFKLHQYNEETNSDYYNRIIFKVRVLKSYRSNIKTDMGL